MQMFICGLFIIWWQELYVGASDLVSVSGKTASRTGLRQSWLLCCFNMCNFASASADSALFLLAAMRLFNINHLIGMKKAISWGNHPNRSLPKRKISVSVMSFDTVNPHTRTTISGYWVGPDAEDGWGYVEAVVDRSVWMNIYSSANVINSLQSFTCLSVLDFSLSRVITFIQFKQDHP